MSDTKMMNDEELVEITNQLVRYKNFPDWYCFTNAIVHRLIARLDHEIAEGKRLEHVIHIAKMIVPPKYEDWHALAAKEPTDV